MQWSGLEDPAAFDDAVFPDVFSLPLVSPNFPLSSPTELLPSALCFAVISFPSSIIHVHPHNFRCLIYISGSWKFSLDAS